MSNIQIFYHMYCANDCFERFIGTYNKMVLSGLLERAEKINVVLVGPEKATLREKLKDYSKVETHIRPNSGSEADTLNMIWEYCKTNDGNILYLHSKGVTKPKRGNIQDWKNLMEYFLIERYGPCVESLQTNDVCGVNYLGGRPHYSGNFWWATARHIRRLKQLKPELACRLYCEYWLFDITAKIERKEIFNSGLDHYKNAYPREKYAIEN